jgi:hypothetical protein
VSRSLLLLTACGEKVGMRGPLRSPEIHLPSSDRCNAPSPSFASLTRPLPAQRGEVKIESRSRGAFASESCPNKSSPQKPDLRQMNPVVDETGFITIRSRCRSPDEAKRNPGTINKPQCRPGFRPGYEEKKKEAERRKTLFRNHRNLRCGTRPTGRARLPAFHHGSYRRESSSLRRSSGQASRDRRQSWRVTPASAGPGCSEHLARRS